MENGRKPRKMIYIYGGKPPHLWYLCEHLQAGNQEIWWINWTSWWYSWVKPNNEQHTMIYQKWVGLEPPPNHRSRIEFITLGGIDVHVFHSCCFNYCTWWYHHIDGNKIIYLAPSQSTSLRYYTKMQETLNLLTTYHKHTATNIASREKKQIQ